MISRLILVHRTFILVSALILIGHLSIFLAKNIFLLIILNQRNERCPIAFVEVLNLGKR